MPGLNRRLPGTLYCVVIQSILEVCVRDQLYWIAGIIGTKKKLDACMG